MKQIIVVLRVRFAFVYISYQWKSNYITNRLKIVLLYVDAE